MDGIDKNTFKQIFYDHWDEFKLAHPRFDRPDTNDTIAKMLGCGDPNKRGYVQYRCCQCGEVRRIAFTCKSCFCLSCAKGYTERWADFIGRRLLPGIIYRHVVLTLPEFLRTWFYRNPTLLRPFMRAGHACLKDILQTACGSKLDIGNIIVLQTAGRSGHYNPHLHILMTAGGIDPNGQWKSVSYIPYEMMHKKWQYHLLNMLRKNVSDPAVEKDIDRAWNDYSKGFVAYLQPGKVPPGGQGLAKYLAKYVVAPPISVRRIEAYDGKTVRYGYRDHKTGQIVHETLPVLRFIGRMIQHILPKGFQRIRYYGLHGNVRYQQVREQLAQIVPTDSPIDPRGYRVLPAKPFQQRFFDSFGKDPLLCPKCHNDMSLELIYHPQYGILREFLLVEDEELPDEGQTVESATGRTLHRAERLVQLPLPFL